MKKSFSVLGTGSLVWVTLFCLELLAGASTAAAQTQTQTSRQQEFYPLESVPTEGEQPLEGPLHPLLREELPVEGQPLEGPIDPAAYIMGPGDLVGVTVMGGADRDLLARVSADGTLRIATLGIIQAGGRSFQDVRAQILEIAGKSYKTDQIAVYLVELRNFKASVGGMVWAPGTYNLTATDRATTLLSRAGGFYNPERKEEDTQLTQLKAVLEREKKEEKITPLPSYSARRAQIIHRDGTRDNVDLMLFLRGGDPAGNPYVMDGDFLLIPPLNAKSGVIGVFGAVHHQGLVEYLPTDQLKTALLLSGGITPDARRDSVEITRFIGETAEFTTFYVNLNDSGTLELPLLPDDRIYVRPHPTYHPQLQVELRGEFIKPGFYPVGAHGTRILDIVRKAGGFTARASLKEAILTRQFGQELVDPEYERLRLMQAADMTPLEYKYFKNKSQEMKGRVVLDLYALIEHGDSTQNILLQDQDILEVPPITHTVKVSGQVNQPGIVDYEPGKSYKYYIEKSGGLSWNASKGKIRVIKGVSGIWVKPGKTQIEEGDTIFIPEKSDVDYWQTYKDVMLVLTQFATIYLIIHNVNK
jgi:protein involved in polysaccharide export with SLBB domain